jgi:hypothetical protein
MAGPAVVVVAGIVTAWIAVTTTTGWSPTTTTSRAWR